MKSTGRIYNKPEHRMTFEGILFRLRTGIPWRDLESNIKDILNPYFTTKKNGTGLGLSIVNKIINDHNGIVEFSNFNNGAKVEIKFYK